MSCVELPPNGTVALVITLQPESADHPEILEARRAHAASGSRAAGCTKDADSPIPPDSYTTPPETREHWDDDSDDDDEHPAAGTPRAGAAATARGSGAGDERRATCE